MSVSSAFHVFFFNDTATTEIYTLSLHDALPICCARPHSPHPAGADPPQSARESRTLRGRDRKSTRLNSSHSSISYAVFCLKKKKNVRNLRHFLINIHICSSVTIAAQKQSLSHC